jgi:hypothetical protein
MMENLPAVPHKVMAEVSKKGITIGEVNFL